MRELYACQLTLEETGPRSIRQLVTEWIARGMGIEPGELESADPTTAIEKDGHVVDIERVPMLLGEGVTFAWRHADDEDPTLDWRTLLAIAPPADLGDASVFTIRIGLERRSDAFRVAPPRYEFGAPTIVRSLLREHMAFDASTRVEPRYRTRRAADVTDLADLIRSSRRRLPVIVVTRDRSGAHVVDALALAHQLAGLAHVEVLTTHLAAQALYDEVGAEHAVWGGAVRLYWPGFGTGSGLRDPLWTSGRLGDPEQFVRSMRSRLGALGAAEVPENAVVQEARRLRRQRLHDDDTVPMWVDDVIDDLERDREDLKSEVTRLEVALTEAQERADIAEGQLRDVQAQFRVVHIASESDGDAPLDLDSLTILEAFELVKREACEHVVFLPECDESVTAFSSYASPRRFVEALTAVSDASEAWNDGTLGQGFGRFFADRGYEFSKNNPAATARKTRSAYRRRYDGNVVVMEPHLKVDQATSPDQCLRIYWYVDEDSRKLVIGHIGRHLPD
ncbi:MAG TPA: hypothetical protein VGK17_09360 [Propionicimonas sp.]|jgi:hypothetical protein